MIDKDLDQELEALIEAQTKSAHPVRDNPERVAIVRKVLERLAAQRIKLSMTKIHAICHQYAGDPEPWIGETAWRRYLAHDWPELLERVRKQ